MRQPLSSTTAITADLLMIRLTSLSYDANGFHFLFYLVPLTTTALIMTRTFVPCLLMALLFAAPALSQQTHLPNTLLWKISGNGLKKDSYLYGSMHLQDKRIFNFGDSVYYFLEKADGFAMEVDFQEMMDSVIHRTITNRLQAEHDESEDEYKNIVDSLFTTLEKSDRKNRKLLDNIRKRKIKNALKNKEMSTILDGWLYAIAMRRGKWMGAVEDVSDQLDLVNELGGDMQKEDLLANDKTIRARLEEMTQIYLRQDLNKIYELSTYNSSAEYRDALLIKRNLKMAFRMDSLSNVRSMFFTVGAAHLPGDSGVISLLQKKGFTVTPVFSQNKVDPFVYFAQLSELPWVKNEDENKTYTVEMPGKASEMNVYGELLKMRFYFDIATLGIYMSASMIAHQNVDLEKLLTNFTKTGGGRIEDKKIYREGDARFAEGTYYAQQYFYHLRLQLKGNMLYMLMIAHQKKKDLEGPDTKRFFNSLTVTPPDANATPTASLHKSEDKAFEVLFPAKPKRNAAIESASGTSEWDVSAFEVNDTRTQMYYAVRTQDLRPGYIVTGDSLFFVQVRESVGSAIATPTRDETETFQSFPALRYEGLSENGGLMYRILTVLRGNRIYTLLTLSPADEDDYAASNQFFNSFRLLDYKPGSLLRQYSPDSAFYTVTSAPVLLVHQVDTAAWSIASTAIPEQVEYTVFQSADAVSYNILRNTFAKFYWVEHDSLLFNERIPLFVAETDSIIYKRRVTNGNLQGLEILADDGTRFNHKKVRFILDGDSLYTLLAYIPPAEINLPAHQAFFDNFRLRNENTSPFITRDKTAEIYEALHSSDSATFEQAKSAISSTPFNAGSLPTLHKAITEKYMDDSAGYGQARNMLIWKLNELADSTTVEFVRKQYSLQSDSLEINKSIYVDLLASIHTSASYRLLKDLLLNNPPKQHDSYPMSGANDSLELAATLFPEALTLLNNPLYFNTIVGLTNELLDSNMISFETVNPYLSNLLHVSDTALAAFKKDEEGTSIQLYPLMKMLSRFNNTDANTQLQNYVKLDHIHIKQEALLLLLKNGQHVQPEHFVTLAANVELRASFYDELVQLKKQDLFPIPYRTQKLMAESLMFNYATDDDYSPEKVKLLGERTLVFKGEKSRFFLYKITYGVDEPSSYLGVCGGFSADKKEFINGATISGLYTENEYDSKQLEKQLAALLAEMAEY